ncbi:MAG: pseudouridylate synthase [uncultured bacterium (gcode 4)]|uniref:Pseudouridylate synthase n=1 Tax=uncultured bacterium (gcode 4) TaxID=1234023 RepID=K1X3W4_9BACT|nr:MAG: pseudouridylate synthase [uncultured bacterium (gcode 4)]
MLNKPLGYVASKADLHNKTIYEILPPEYINYYYIWRLDKNSHGLLLLTDDPALVNEFEHPKFAIEKEYIVELDQELDVKDIQRALSGVKDEDEILRAIKITKDKKKYHYAVILNEWKKRHLRRMFKAIGYRVMDLERVREGKYTLGDLKIGEWKVIS